WFEGYGMTSRTDAQGEFLGDRRKVYGGIAGVGVTVTPGVTLGLSVDQGRTDIDMPGATGRIDLTQLGLIGNFERRPWNLGGAAPVSGSGVSATRVRMLVGGEIGHSWLVGRQIFDFAIYARLVENLQQSIGDLAISDATLGNAPQLVSGVRESSAGADAGAAF